MEEAIGKAVEQLEAVANLEPNNRKEILLQIARDLTEAKARSTVEAGVILQIAEMNLYKIMLAYGYDYGKRFSFLVIAKDIESAVDISIKTFNSYDYGSCIFNHAELMASEGQYSKPDILLITRKLCR